MSRPAVTFVIMAGGRGERLWPLNVIGIPKVCLPISHGRTLLTETVARLRPVSPGANWLVVTTKAQHKPISEALPSKLRRALLVEPEGKGTAACLTLATAVVQKRNPRAVMVVVPADHWIHWGDDWEHYRRSIREAIRVAASQDAIVTIGMRPTRPHTGFGYLCAGRRVPGPRTLRVFNLVRFVEKPSLRLATQLYQKRRTTYWNSGTFVATADRFMTAVNRWLPEHANRLEPLARYVGTASFGHRASRAYRGLKPISFDHGVMDFVQRGFIVEGNYEWVDVGSWDTWARLGRTSRHTVSVKSRNVKVLAYGRDHVVATVGVHNLLVVHTDFATLICAPEQAQMVREVVKRLAGRPRLQRIIE